MPSVSQSSEQHHHKINNDRRTMLSLAVLLCLTASSLGRPQIHYDLSRQDGKIVGGTVADIKNFPYQVSLQYKGSHFCGASVVSEDWLVTAAHCMYGASASNFSVRAGSSFHASGGAIYPVEEIFTHPNFLKDSDDIGLVKLAQPLQFSDSVRPIELPAEGETVPAESIAVVSGWGATIENGYGSDILLQVAVPVVSTAQCREAYGATLITDHMLCAGVSAGGKDACQGDSGGPLVSGGKLVGVVSWGHGCARPGVPGVYADVADFRSWITSISGL